MNTVEPGKWSSVLSPIIQGGRRTVVVVVGLLLFGANSVGFSQPKNLVELARKFEIEIRTQGEPFPVRNSHGPIAGSDASPQAVDKYKPWLLSEFDLYPVDLIRKVELKRIVLCTDLAFDGQRRNAVPDFDHDTLYLEVIRGDYDPNYMRRVIHHDFFHIVDWKDDFKLTEDDRWSALNPQGFRYGSGGATAQEDESAGVLNAKLPGFLNRYSQTAVEEDKAEVFSVMVVQAQHVAERSQDDRVLNAKMEQIREAMKSFCPSVDDSFWERAKRLRRPVTSDP